MFRKILSWFAGIVLFSFVGFILTTLWTNQRGTFQQDLFRRLHNHLSREAMAAYEHGGAEELARTLGIHDRDFPARHYLIDAAGRDLVTGEDKSSLLSEATEPRGFRFPPPSRFLIRRVSSDGRYVYLINAEPPPLFSNLAVYSWLVVAIVLLCYALAHTLVRPIRHLHAALARFGRGDLTSRSNLSRNDELGALSLAFDEMAHRIGTLLTAERRLLQDVSHELRSPLARLRFAVQLARTSSEPHTQLARADKEVERLSTLIGDLLQVTRAEGDPESRNLEQINLLTFVKGIVDDCLIEAEAKGCGIEAKATGSPCCFGDRELIRRAFENVIRNAIHHSPQGTTVVVDLSVDGKDVVLSVRDAGPGVPDEALDNIFKPFYRVEQDRGRDNGGVGLGLAIARRAVAAHGGSIHASKESPGLSVEIRLPEQPDLYKS